MYVDHYDLAWRTERVGLGVHYKYMQKQGLPLWASGQSTWLQIQRSGFDSRR
jgi:hypothetical protein